VCIDEGRGLGEKGRRKKKEWEKRSGIEKWK